MEEAKWMVWLGVQSGKKKCPKVFEEISSFVEEISSFVEEISSFVKKYRRSLKKYRRSLKKYRCSLVADDRGAFFVSQEGN